MSSDDENEKYIQQKLYRSRGKCAIYARQSDVYLELKHKPPICARPPVASGVEIDSTLNSPDIGHDVWYLISMHIDPEDVQTFALICKGTSKLVNTRAFWRNLYRRHCLQADKQSCNSELPAHLQLKLSDNCDTKAWRALAVAALYYCYKPLKTRLELGYSMDWLLQRTFVACSQRHMQYVWLTSYTFRNNKPGLLVDEEQDEQVVNSWETLADHTDAALKLTPQQSASPYEGVILLLIISRQFTPLPLQLAYGQQQSHFRLKATRELLCTDMRAKNLELDFSELNQSYNNLSLTVKYARIETFKVLPWWHPDFKRFLK
ncbi:fsd [Drosophila busckii]|uniref:Fsd n=1 Tax=Drosophila busckii TaxID=30019 RepID=A0A0M5IZR9_DROBS|nr:transmembrane protein 183 [Drosophila busckii]ALC41136.1 fsd [Drosophila busckii]